MSTLSTADSAQRKLLPNRLRAIRKSAGLSQEELAELISVSKVTISSLEVGRMNLTFDYMKRLARVFDLAPLEPAK